MKTQDILFLLVFVILLWRHNRKIIAASGITCILFSIPLFSKWIFFTAERLTWYGAAFLLLALLIPKRQRSTVK